MKKYIKMIGIIGIMAVISVCSYWLGSAKTNAIEVEKVVTVEKVIEVVPDGYIDTKSADFKDNYIDMNSLVSVSANGESLQLYFNDGTGYYWEK